MVAVLWEEDRLKVSDAKAENSWWLDPDDRALTYRYGACSSCVYCLCEKNSVLKTCECSAFERWVVDEGQRLTSRLSNRCAFLNGTEVLTSTCPNEDDARLGPTKISPSVRPTRRSEYKFSGIVTSS